MRQLSLVCLMVMQCVLALSSDEEEWSRFKTKYNKVYRDIREETFRRAIWAQRLKQIRLHNDAADMELHSYRMGMNQFGDKTTEELIMSYKGVEFERIHVARDGRRSTFTKKDGDLPAEVDWRKKGIVSPVANQEMCGSGYAFAATGSLAGLVALQSGQLNLLSVQNLLDCSTTQGNKGCRGGFAEHCFLYIGVNGGIDSESSYPYEARDGRCRFNSSDVIAGDAGYGEILSGDETVLQQAVALIGPIATHIDGSPSSFRFYSSGVYDDPSCNSTYTDHGMLVVGYGKDASSGKDYWLLKNTYGVDWGMEGYMLMARNKGNRCGVATNATYPLI